MQVSCLGEVLIYIPEYVFMKIIELDIADEVMQF